MNQCLNLLRGTVVLTLLLFFSLTNVFAAADPPKYVKTNWGNSMFNFDVMTSGDQYEFCIEILEDNELHIQLKAYFASPNMSGCPDAYIMYNFGGLESGITAKIEASELEPVVVNGITMYVWATAVPVIDLSRICRGDGAEVPFNFTYTLVTRVGNEYVVYPTQDYDGPGEIFSAAVFPENAPGNQQPPSYEGSKLLCCPGGVQVSSRSTNDEQQGEISTELKNKLTAFPNPFTQSLTLDVPSGFDQEQSQVLIQDITGKTRWSGRLTDAQQLTIDTRSLEAGIYIVTVKHKNRQLHKKVVKNNF